MRRAHPLGVLLALAPFACGQPTPATTSTPSTPTTQAAAASQPRVGPPPEAEPSQKTRPPPKDEKNAAPDVNEAYRENTKIDRWVDRFENEGREVRDHRQAILDELDLKRGMVIADIGTGTGLFTIPFARAVGDTGKVYAVDVLQLFLDHVADKTDEAGLSNVELVKASQKSAELPSRSIDLAFLCDTYHHIEYPRTYLSTVHEALRQDGELVVIDLRRAPGKSRAWVLEHVRAGKEAVVAEIEQAGFELIAESEILEENYFLRFKRR